MTLRRTRARRSVAVALAIASFSLAPARLDARPPQEPDPEARREEVRARQAVVDLEVDVLEAQGAEVAAALDQIEANVATQQAELDEAERAVQEAEQDLVEAERAVADAEARIEELNARSDELVVEAFVHPPVENAFDTLSAESLADASIKQAILDIEASFGADLLDQLDAAHEDLQIERRNREQAAAEAEEKRASAQQKLADLHAALAQQQDFADQLEASLEHKLIEAENLKAIDRELSRQIAEQQAAIARYIEAARRAQAEAARRAAAAAQQAGATTNGGGGGGGGGGAPGAVLTAPGLATVRCPNGGSITVASSIGGQVQALLDASGGLGLCGWGYRSAQRQVELRIAHCGSSSYAIYQMPASACEPPTARPGMSMHERGLAIDFTCNGGGIPSRSSPCYQWLADHASSYGLYNLPSEPWHWSTNGS